SGATGIEELQASIRKPLSPWGEEVPAALRAVVEKALEKDPAERYQSIREMAVDLRRLVRQPPEALATPTRPWSWAAAVVLLLLAGLAAWKFWLGPGAPPIRSI